MKKTKVDIIGGGISGLAAAIAIKKLNKKIDVNIYEKHKKIGYNPEGRRCGEAHSIEGKWKKWKPNKKSIFNEIYKVETIVGKKTYTLKRKKGTSCILNRQEFISNLGKKAEKLGAYIQTDNKIKTIKELDAKYIIDASGCPSFVKKELKINHGITGKTYQQTIENSNFFIKDTVKIFITEKTGYYWIFPRNPDKKEINLGVGIVGKKQANLKKILNEFKEKYKVTGEINYKTGGLIPVGLQRPLKHENILFVGDTGVGTFPYTGEGIYRALLSGDIAADCIVKKQIRRYPHEINQNFIKWDLIGKNVIRISSVLESISPKAVVSMHQKYLNFFISN